MWTKQRINEAIEDEKEIAAGLATQGDMAGAVESMNEIARLSNMDAPEVWIASWMEQGGRDGSTALEFGAWFAGGVVSC